MKKNIEKILEDYKNCTIDIINMLKIDDITLLNDKMNKRQCILDEIILDKDSKDEVKEAYEKLNIIEIENEVKNLMRTKALLLKKKLNAVSKNKIAVNAYGNVGNSAKIFSKKI